jgi:putative addiction module CopG family antidote
LAAGLLGGFLAGRNPKAAALILAAICAAMIYDAGLSAYHAGVEWHFWEGPVACTGDGPGVQVTASLSQRLKHNTAIRCDVAALRLFGISLAGYLVFLSLALAGAAAATLYRNRATGLSLTICARPLGAVLRHAHLLHLLRRRWPLWLAAPVKRIAGFYRTLRDASKSHRTERNMEQLSITLTGEMARRVEDAVASGRYASASEVIRDALREWEIVQVRREQELLALRKDIAEGLSDIEAGRVGDSKEIIRKGEELLAAQNSRSA